MERKSFRLLKVMVAILALALAVMAAPMFASAASNVECVKVVAGSTSDDWSRYQFMFSQSVDKNDIITFYIKSFSTDCNLEVRELNTKYVNEKFGAGGCVVSVGDGWYAVRAEVTEKRDYWAIKVASDNKRGDTVYIRDIRINGKAIPVDTAVNQCSDWYSKPALTASKTTMSVADSALTYDWSKHVVPDGGTYTPETFTGTLPTYDKTPYTWKVNAALGGKTNLPAVNLAATGRYTNVTNVNDQLISALKTTTFKDMNNMIFVISDGMGQNCITLSEHFAGNLIMNDMPNYGTSSTLSYVAEGGTEFTTTDSAAGGTALSAGYKTRYYYEAMDANRNDIPQITEVLREKFGKIIGVVTTGWAYDATPAVYGGAHAKRGDSDEIAKEMRTFAPDLFIGSGLTDFNFLPSGQDIGVYSNWSTAIKSTKDKVWVSVESNNTSKDDDIRYTDGWSNARPTISQAMAYSLTWLQAKSDKNDNVGFFLMFENGMTDDAGHHGEAEDMICEVQATDEAVAIALKFACENPDTAVIVTADHDTGGLTLNSGWESNLAKLKWTAGGGHSRQDVAVYAIGKNTEVFDGQEMYNCQVGKITGYLFGLKNFGTTDSIYSIDNIIAGIKNDIPDAEDQVTDKVTGQVLHVRADAATSKVTLTLSGLNMKKGAMGSVAVQVPAGATAIKVTTSSGQVVVNQKLDKVTNYVAKYTYYDLGFKLDKDATSLTLEFTGSMKKNDEIWVDSLSIAGSVNTFDSYNTSNAKASGSTTVQVYTTTNLPAATPTPKPTAKPTATPKPTPTATPKPGTTPNPADTSTPAPTTTTDVTQDVTADVTVDVTTGVTTDVTQDKTQDVTADVPTAAPTAAPTSAPTAKPSPDANATIAPQDSTATPAAGDTGKDKSSTVLIIVGTVAAVTVIAGSAAAIFIHVKKR